MVFRHASELPDFERPAEGILHYLFCQGEIVNAEDAGQGGDPAARIVPEEMFTEFHYMLNFITGRTSTWPSTTKMGQPFESSAASLRSLASINL